VGRKTTHSVTYSWLVFPSPVSLLDILTSQYVADSLVLSRLKMSWSLFPLCALMWNAGYCYYYYHKQHALSLKH